MAGNYALKGALKGLMAGARGVVSGKLAVEKASNERARKEAEVALENRKWNWEQAKEQFEEQRLFAKEGREAIESKNKQAAMKAEEEQKKIANDRLNDLNDDFDEVDEDIVVLETELETETDPEKRKIMKEKLLTKRKRLRDIALRMGKRMPGFEAEQKAEIDEAAAVAADKRKEAAAVAEHTRTKEVDEVEKAKKETAKQEALTALEKNKSAFSDEEYDKIKAQIQIGDAVDVTDFVKPPSTTDFSSTQDILDMYTDIPNKTVLNNLVNAITSKDEAQRLARSAHRWLEGRPFEKLDDVSKERAAKLFINEVMQNVPGGDIVKRHLRAYRILKTQLPALLIDVAKAKANGKDLGRLQQAKEGFMRWIGGTSDPEITGLRTKITDVLNGYIALRSGAQVTETERRMYGSIFANIGTGYEVNKAAIEGLMTNVKRDLAANYEEILGPEWGKYATDVDFKQDNEPPEVWISEVLAEYELTGKSDIIIPEALRPFSVDAIVHIFVRDAEAIMKEKNLSLKGYAKSVEAQLRKEYPDLSDAEIKEHMDTFRERVQGAEGGSDTEDETETDDTDVTETWSGKSEEERIALVGITVESDGADAAKKELMEVFGLSDEEAQALIDKATTEEEE